jgi:hypothetical protein
LAQTLCPACGHSPIPPRAEECPACGEPFAFLPTHKKARNRFVDREDTLESESTVFGGGVHSAVAAHPWQAATVLFIGAAIWFVRAAAAFGGPPEPDWLYGIVGANLLLGLLLILDLGPARLLAQLGMLAQLGAALYLGQGDLERPVHLLYAAFGAVGLVLVIGEPSGVRRALGLLGGLVVAAAATTALVVDARVGGPGGAPRQELTSAQAGFRLLLPPGYALAQPGELAAHLKLPSGGWSTAAFASGKERAVGLLLVKKDPAAQAIGGCGALHHALGGTNVVHPLPQRPPAALGDSAVVYELRTFSGATGRLACGKLPDDRFVALAVLGVIPDPEVASRAFEAVGAGLSLK